MIYPLQTLPLPTTVPTNQTFHLLLASTRNIRGTKSSFTPSSYFQCIYWLPREKKRAFVILSNLDIWSCHSDNRISKKPGFYLSSINTVYTSCQ